MLRRGIGQQIWYVSYEVSDVTLHPFTVGAIPALVALVNPHFPDAPKTVESWELKERRRNPSWPFSQQAAKLDD